MMEARAVERELVASRNAGDFVNTLTENFVEFDCDRYLILMDTPFARNTKKWFEHYFANDVLGKNFPVQGKRIYLLVCLAAVGRITTAQFDNLATEGVDVEKV